ncbi:unnamed protein product, partial [Ectocarpus fasciculatus]
RPSAHCLQRAVPSQGNTTAPDATRFYDGGSPTPFSSKREHRLRRHGSPLVVRHHRHRRAPGLLILPAFRSGGALLDLLPPRSDTANSSRGHRWALPVAPAAAAAAVREGGDGRRYDVAVGHYRPWWQRRLGRTGGDAGVA